MGAPRPAGGRRAALFHMGSRNPGIYVLLRRVAIAADRRVGGPAGAEGLGHADDCSDAEPTEQHRSRHAEMAHLERDVAVMSKGEGLASPARTRTPTPPLHVLYREMQAG